VVIPLSIHESDLFRESFPTRWLKTVGTSKTTMRVGNNQAGPRMRSGGSAKYLAQIAINASTACQRGSGLSMCSAGFGMRGLYLILKSVARDHTCRASFARLFRCSTLYLSRAKARLLYPRWAAQDGHNFHPVVPLG